VFEAWHATGCVYPLSVHCGADEAGASAHCVVGRREEHVETVALGWTGHNVYVRVTDSRCRFSAT
jgi:hypothetical protein